jgi:hypothetical protein
MQTKGIIDLVIYYRVAVQSEQSSSWKWQSSTLTSMSSVFDVLNAYAYIPRTALRVFLSSSPECLDKMLTSANDGRVSGSIPAEQFLQGDYMSLAEMKRLALEMHPEEDYDSPYIFTLPANTQQALAWARLLTRVYNRELKP